MPDTSLYPRIITAPPAIDPAWYGLFNVAQMPIPASDGKWQNGIEFQPLPYGPSGSWVNPCPPYSTTVVHKTPRFGRPTVYADPFTLYEGIDCSPAGFSYENAVDRAKRALVLNEEHGCEAQLWTGALGSSPNLANPNTIKLNGTTAVSLPEGLYLLEDAIGHNYGGRGVIHMPRSGVSALESTNLSLIEDGPQLRTRLGTLIAAGGGYPGTAPDGTTPSAGTQWWYATGTVQILRSEIFVPATEVGQALARNTNDLAVYAERTYVCAWDAPLLTPDPATDGLSLPIAWAVLVNLNL